jgi:ATP-dependent RNA helicase DDX41
MTNCLMQSLTLISDSQRELARQTYDGFLALADMLHKGGYAQIKVLLCMGGINMQDQASVFHG